MHEAQFPLQVQVGEFSIGGGTIYDGGQVSGGVEVGVSVADGVQHQVDMVTYENYSFLEQDECHSLAIIPHQNQSGLFLFMDMLAHGQLALRSECGGGTGVWEAADDGLWAFPLVICLVCWFLLRMTGCYLDWKQFGGFGSLRSQICTQVCKYIILTVGANIAVAPILNMEQTEGCEQMLTSMYSNRMQIAVMVGLVFLILAMLRVVYWVFMGEDDNPDTTDAAELDLEMRFARSIKMCLGIVQSEAPWYIRCAEASVPTILIIATLMLFIFQVWTMCKLSWAFSWGFLFDFHWKWPKIELTGQITAFQVLAMCLWSLDTVGVVTAFLSKADTAVQKARDAVEAAQDVAEKAAEVFPQSSASEPNPEVSQNSSITVEISNAV